MNPPPPGEDVYTWPDKIFKKGGRYKINGLVYYYVETRFQGMGDIFFHYFKLELFGIPVQFNEYDMWNWDIYEL